MNIVYADRILMNDADLSISHAVEGFKRVRAWTLSANVIIMQISFVTFYRGRIGLQYM